VALLSAKKYAPSVVPIMLYPGNYNAYMKWFEQEGGLAFHHRTSLLPRWQVREGPRDQGAHRPPSKAVSGIL